jgi:hypothetical protein
MDGDINGCRVDIERHTMKYVIGIVQYWMPGTGVPWRLNQASPMIIMMMMIMMMVIICRCIDDVGDHENQEDKNIYRCTLKIHCQNPIKFTGHLHEDKNFYRYTWKIRCQFHIKIS